LWSTDPAFAVKLSVNERRFPARCAGGTPDVRATIGLTFDHREAAPFLRRAVAVQRALDEACAQPPREPIAQDTSNPAHALSVAFLSGLPRTVDDEDHASAQSERSEMEMPHPDPGCGLVVAAHAEDDDLEIKFEQARETDAELSVDGIAGATRRLLEDLTTREEAWRCTQAENGFRLLPDAQAQRRVQVNATAAPLPEGFLFSGFLRQLHLDRDAPAVIAPERVLTYGELYSQACALAHELRALAVGPNELVAILMPKGWEQIAAAIGIQLAGAAYLPLDVDLPSERVRFLLEHGEACAIVTTASHRGSGQVPSCRPVIEIDRLEPAPVGDAPPVVKLSANDLAYVIFTSGSTGTPKGVMIDHQGAWNTVVDINNRFGVTSSDRVLALSRLSFDLSAYDIFGLLAAGGTIVIPDAKRVNDPAHWAELRRRHGITIWNSVPALMQLFTEFASSRREIVGDSLRLVLMSGDWIPISLPEQIRRVMPRGEIVSLGGATEASIWSILYPIREVDPAWTSVPYGRPMLNQTFQVLHPNLAPCPDGVAGELYIGGVGLARGYWKDPEKTAAQFVTHPHTGERLYRTGDLGRHRPDVEIEFLGREDFQVKIHGFRIELGEVEAPLAAHPDVRRAVIVAKGTVATGRHLVAYVAPVDGVIPDQIRCATSYRNVCRNT